MWKEQYILIKGLDLALALVDLQEAVVTLPDRPPGLTFSIIASWRPSPIRDWPQKRAIRQK